MLCPLVCFLGADTETGPRLEVIVDIESRIVLAGGIGVPRVRTDRSGIR
jgi:hypothetical protein